jgi:hypothetical protein
VIDVGATTPGVPVQQSSPAATGPTKDQLIIDARAIDAWPQLDGRRADFGQGLSSSEIERFLGPPLKPQLEAAIHDLQAATTPDGINAAITHLGTVTTQALLSGPPGPEGIPDRPSLEAWAQIQLAQPGLDPNSDQAQMLTKSLNILQSPSASSIDKSYGEYALRDLLRGHPELAKRELADEAASEAREKRHPDIQKQIDATQPGIPTPEKIKLPPS